MGKSFSQEAVEGDLPSDYIRLYHYTDLKGATGIYGSRKIRKSTEDTSTDALFGAGTYLTDKAPEKHTKLEIAKDIWVNLDKFHDKMVKDGRADFVVVVVIKESMVKLVDPEHHIWLYPKKDLDLQNASVVYEWYVEETDEVERHSYENDMSYAGAVQRYT